MRTPNRLRALRFFAVALAAGLLLASSCFRGAPPSAAAAKPQAGGVRRLSAAGTPEEIGRSIGREFAPEIRKLHAIFLRVGEFSTLQRKRTLYARAAAVGRQLSEDDRAELRGLGEASGVGYEAALFMSLFYDVVYGPAACRGLAAWGPVTADGKLLHARNLDWPDYPGSPLRKNNLIVNVRPSEGIEYCFLTWPGFQAVLTGTNRRGLTVSFNQLPNTRDDREAPGEPVLFTLKRVLRTCGDLDAAVRLITETRPAGSGSILISDAAAKAAAVVEVSGGKVGVRRPAAGAAMIGNANHATREAGLPGLRSGEADWPTCTVAAELERKLDAEAARQVLADPRVLQYINILSVVFVPAENRMLLSCGRMRAAEGKFREYEIFLGEDPNAGAGR